MIDIHGIEDKKRKIVAFMQAMRIWQTIVPLSTRYATPPS